jgi:hypothetical protein
MQFRDSGFGRLSLLRVRTVRFSRLRGLGLDLAACSSKLARECRGTRLCLIECAALLLGACRRRLARRADVLGQGSGLLLLLLQGFTQLGSGSLRSLLLLHSFIDRLLRLRILRFDVALRPGKLARERRGSRLCFVERTALFSALAVIAWPAASTAWVRAAVFSCSCCRDFCKCAAATSAACFCCTVSSTVFCACAACVSRSRRVPASSLTSALFASANLVSNWLLAAAGSPAGVSPREVLRLSSPTACRAPTSSVPSGYSVAKATISERKYRPMSVAVTRVAAIREVVSLRRGLFDSSNWPRQEPAPSAVAAPWRPLPNGLVP